MKINLGMLLTNVFISVFVSAHFTTIVLESLLQLLLLVLGSAIYGWTYFVVFRHISDS